MELTTHVDIVIIGAGINGLWTTYNLLKAGRTPLLLDQFSLPHTRGSSHGASRIIRSSYTEEHHADMMPQSYKMWKDLEKDARDKILHKCANLTIVNKNSSKKQNVIRNLQRHNIHHDTFCGSEASSKFPGLKLDSTVDCIVDHEAGILNADKCIHVLLNEIKKMGGHKIEQCRVKSIVPINSNKVIIKTPNGDIISNKLIITCGAWANKLLKCIGLDIPIQAVRITVYYWKERGTNEVYSAKNNFPTVSDHSGKVFTYSVPTLEYPYLMKLCYFGGVACDPDNRDVNTAEIENYRKHRLQQLQEEKITQCYPQLETKHSIMETCMFANTVDDEFVIDKHPMYSNIIFGVGFSGLGFKSAPVAAKILMDMALGGDVPTYIEKFSINRFRNKTSIK